MLPTEKAIILTPCGSIIRHRLAAGHSGGVGVKGEGSGEEKVKREERQLGVKPVTGLARATDEIVRRNTEHRPRRT